MEYKQPSQLDLLIESHLDLRRQGPGSAEMTLKALRFVELPEGTPRIADLGCGTGGQTMLLAQHTGGDVTGLDMMPAFIDIFNEQAKTLSLEERVRGLVGSIDALPFAEGSLDLIWSEGVVDGPDFGKMLAYWHDFLKEGAYVALTSPSWFSDARPEEVQRFWSDAESGMASIEHNITALRASGYQLIAAFALPEVCWMEHYYIPRKASEQQLLQKYPGNRLVEDYVRSMAYEVDLYERFKQHYGYVFYVGRRL